MPLISCNFQLWCCLTGFISPLWDGFSSAFPAVRYKWGGGAAELELTAQIGWDLAHLLGLTLQFGGCEGKGLRKPSSRRVRCEDPQLCFSFFLPTFSHSSLLNPFLPICSFFGATHIHTQPYTWVCVYIHRFTHMWVDTLPGLFNLTC